MQRKTYALIDGEILTKNVTEIRNKYPEYQYYFGVVKNNAYHHGMRCVLDLKKGGINYFAVSSLEEALDLRKYDLETPVLCLEPIDLEFIDDILNNNITITIESLDYVKELLKKDLYSKVKVHFKIDSGMHRLGFYQKKDINEAMQILKDEENVVVEGIYSHFATSGVMDPYYDKQVDTFLSLTKDIDLKSIPIIHMGRSLSLVQHKKLSFCNGIRLGIILYGFAQSQEKDNSIKGKIRSLRIKILQKKNHCSKTNLQNDLNVKPAFSLYSQVFSIRKVSEKEVIGYNIKEVEEDGYILTIPIGYADGVTKNFKSVWIENNYYPIVSDSMDMIMIFSKDPMKIGSKVEIIGEHLPLKLVCQRVGKNAYHLLNDISNRVVRAHQREDEKVEIYY